MIEQQTERLTPVSRANGWQLGASSVVALGATVDDLGPRRIGGVMDRGVDVMRAHFGLLMGIALCLYIPVHVLFFFFDPFDQLWADMLQVGSASTMGTVVSGVAARAFGAHISGHRITARMALKFSPAELLGLIGLSLIIGTCVGLGVCVFFVGMFLASWLLSLAPVVYVLETELGPWARLSYAIKRSTSLVRGSFWRWMALALVIGLLNFVLVMPLAEYQVPHVRAAAAFDWGVSVALVDWSVCLIGGLLAALGLVFSGSLYASFYFDQRARLEGVDLYLAMVELEQGATK